ncbi:MAG: PTS sugar transporter subunit IIA [Deltaproteobacteria bacterium]|jgi:PTS system nitrogen regulatory IIA component|nr:PTS sugar transporter subunit IIA [Deltaproteobacteria bacterium]
MNLDNILSQESIFLDFTADDKEDALRQLCTLAADVLGLEMAPIYSAIRYREALGSTALGSGLVLPHGKVDIIDSTRLFLARPGERTKLDFGCPDGLPARLIALILTPLRPTPEYIKLLAIVGRIWNSPRNACLLMDCPDQKSFFATFMGLSGALN